MIRHILRLEAVMPALSRATFGLRAPYPPRDASKAPSTSGSIGSGAFGRGGCASIRQYVERGTPRILRCADTG